MTIQKQTLDDLEQWLLLKAPNATAGIRYSTTNCPVARMYRDKYPNSTVAIGTVTGVWIESQETPWDPDIQAFMRLVDRGRRSSCIRVRTCLRYVQQVRASQAAAPS